MYIHVWLYLYYRQFYNVLSPTAYLSHSCEEALWIEESCHPECVRSTIEAPCVELGVFLDQLSEPETQCAGLPGDLCTQKRVLHKVGNFRNVFKQQEAHGP